MGLDMPEMGALGYTDVDVHMPGRLLGLQTPGMRALRGGK
jgi:hypothetical protein